MAETTRAGTPATTRAGDTLTHAGAPATTRGSEPPPKPESDFSIMCWACGAEMKPEHAHYRCPSCGWRDSCCDGPY